MRKHTPGRKFFESPACSPAPLRTRVAARICKNGGRWRNTRLLSGSAPVRAQAPSGRIAAFASGKSVRFSGIVGLQTQGATIF